MSNVSRKRKKGNTSVGPLPFIIAIAAIAALAYYLIGSHNEPLSTLQTTTSPPPRAVVRSAYHPTEKWLQRAYDVDELFHDVYTPCWEGAYGAIGDSYLLAATHDSSLLRFHLIDHDLRRMCTGRWVDDRAWICLAEMHWWNVTGRSNASLV